MTLDMNRLWKVMELTEKPKNEVAVYRRSSLVSLRIKKADDCWTDKVEQLKLYHLIHRVGVVLFFSFTETAFLYATLIKTQNLARLQLDRTRNFAGFISYDGNFQHASPSAS